MVLCGTKNGSSMASLEEPFEAPLFLRVQAHWSRTRLMSRGCGQANTTELSVHMGTIAISHSHKQLWFYCVGIRLTAVVILAFRISERNPWLTNSKQKCASALKWSCTVCGIYECATSSFWIHDMMHLKVWQTHKLLSSRCLSHGIFYDCWWSVCTLHAQLYYTLK